MFELCGPSDSDQICWQGRFHTIWYHTINYVIRFQVNMAECTCCFFIVSTLWHISLTLGMLSSTQMDVTGLLDLVVPVPTCGYVSQCDPTQPVSAASTLTAPGQVIQPNQQYPSSPPPLGWSWSAHEEKTPFVPGRHQNLGRVVLFRMSVAPRRERVPCSCSLLSSSVYLLTLAV